MAGERSLSCTAGHLFDLSRDGYVHLLPNAKPGIVTAAKRNARAIWVVADLARSPFRDQAFDVVTNILSPSNYGEFRRLLKPNGMLAKVVPGPEYLREFRQFLYGERARRTKAAEHTAALFAKHFPDMKQRRVRYEAELEPHHLEAMLRMTPLSWQATEEQVRGLLSHSSFRLTFDFYILWGKPFIG